MLEILSDIDRIVVDGQHRLHALKKANEHCHEADYNKELGFATIRVPVVFLTFDDVGGDFDKTIDDPGLHGKVSYKSRKVFVDLNKDVRKVDKNSLLVLDDSDFSAVAARYLIENNGDLELYTKWSKAGTTLADTDPFFTNIFLLDQFVGILLDDTLEEISEELILESDEDREKAIKKIFCSLHPLYELEPRKMIADFFEKVSFFWAMEGGYSQNLVGTHPKKQPVTTETTAEKRREIRKLHHQHLLGTVVGQRAAFKAVVDAFDHLEGDPEENWHSALEQLSRIHDAGILDRSNPLWMELLVRPGNKMKVNALDASAEVISCLIRRSRVSSLGQIDPDEGRGTEDTKKHFRAAVKKLRELE